MPPITRPASRKSNRSIEIGLRFVCDLAPRQAMGCFCRARRYRGSVARLAEKSPAS
jgi:hypothetical protein